MSIKKERKVISLNDKINIIQRKKDGEKTIDIALSMGLAPTTVRTICNRDFKKIEEVAVNVTTSFSKNITRTRQPIINQMESLLIAWIHDMNQKKLPMSQKTITQKAKCLFEHLKQVDDNNTETSSINFEASRGWFQRFRARAEITSYGATKLNLVKLERPSEYRPSDLQPAENEPAENRRIIRADKISNSSKKNISKALKLIEKAMKLIKRNDPDVTRSFQVLANIKESTKCYQSIFQERKKELIQTKINTFFLPTFYE